MNSFVDGWHLEKLNRNIPFALAQLLKNLAVYILLRITVTSFTDISRTKFKAMV